MYARQIGAGVSLVGSLVALAIPLAGAINFTTLQHTAQRRSANAAGHADPVDMLPTVFIGAVISAAATLPLAWPLQTSMHDLGLLTVLGVVQLAIPCLLLVRLSRVLSAPEIALLGLLEVVFGVTWTWLWAGEQPSTATLTGGALVLGALVANELLALHSRRRLRQLATPGTYG
jgi:drug/metabolite transporter (DMT)-like permease